MKQNLSDLYASNPRKACELALRRTVNVPENDRLDAIDKLLGTSWENARPGDTIVKEQAKHTPGPWNISKLATPQYAPEFAIYAENSAKDLARIVGENSEANALLIAAAPDLLAACKAALPFLRDHVCMTLDQGPADRIALDKMEAAIQRAEGAS